MSVRIRLSGEPMLIDEADLRVARLSALAAQALGGQDKAQRWLQRPRREFGGISPLEMMESEAGARQVELLLSQLDATRQA